MRLAMVTVFLHSNKTLYSNKTPTKTVLLLLLVFWIRVSCIPNWFWFCYIAEVGFELINLCLPLPQPWWDQTVCPMLSPQENFLEYIWKHLSLKVHFLLPFTLQCAWVLTLLFAMHSTPSAYKRGSQTLAGYICPICLMPTSSALGLSSGSITLATQAELTSVHWFLPACLRQKSRLHTSPQEERLKMCRQPCEYELSLAECQNVSCW